MKNHRPKAKLCNCRRCVARRKEEKLQSRYSGSFLQLREVGRMEDDFSDNFKNTRANQLKLKRFIKLWDEIKPHGYKPIQLWMVSTTVLAKSKEEKQ